MNVLALSTAFEHLGLALRRGADLATSHWTPSDQRNERHLFRVLEEQLERSGVNLKELQLLVVTRGPGSYTSLRMGLGVIKTLSLVLEIPAIGVDSLDLLASLAAPRSGPFHVGLACSRQEVYDAVYEFEGAALVCRQPTRVRRIQEFRDDLQIGPLLWQGLPSLETPALAWVRDVPAVARRHPFPDGQALLEAGLRLLPSYQGQFPPLQPHYIKKDA